MSIRKAMIEVWRGRCKDNHVGSKIEFPWLSKSEMESRWCAIETNWSRDSQRMKSNNVRRGCKLQDRGAVQGQNGRQQHVVAQHRGGQEVQLAQYADAANNFTDDSYCYTRRCGAAQCHVCFCRQFFPAQEHTCVKWAIALCAGAQQLRASDWRYRARILKSMTYADYTQWATKPRRRPRSSLHRNFYMAEFWPNSVF